MRTLSRPMFKMGGPIKEGVMHGIREPHFKGQIVGKAMPHIQKALQSFKNIFGKTAPVTKTVPRHGPPLKIPTSTPSRLHKGYPGSGSKIVGPGEAKVTEKVWTPHGWVARDPTYQIGKKIVEGSGWIGKPLKWAGQTLATPTGAIGLTFVGGKWLLSDGTEATDEQVKEITKLNPKLKALQEKGKTKKGSEGDYAKDERETRVNKYLKLMGYDRSRYDAVSKALIDASKIIADRGTLNKKNINRELINPIIQATSARFDKPRQVREAVGLMAAKAEIEKDINKEKDALAKSLAMLNIKKAKQDLNPGVATALMAYMAAKKGKVKGDELKDFIRVASHKAGTPFKHFTKDYIVEQFPQLEGKTAMEIVSVLAETDGVYMIGDEVIEITGGVPTQIK